MTDILLITEQSIKNITNISDNMAGKLLLTAIRESQEINLREILGDALLDELKRQISENDVRETYNQLILQCQYYLAYQSCANICMITSVKIDNAGLQRVSDEKMEPLPVSEVNQIHDYYQKRADFYCERLQNFLLQHKEDYPQLTTRQCNSINANLYSSATCGIFLGGPRSKGTQRDCDGLNSSKSQGVETLDVELTENGTYDYTPRGYGFNSAHIVVNTPEIKNQEKNINITENGTSTVIPDPEFTGMGSVDITVDVHPSERLVRTYTENGVYDITGEYNGGEIHVETNPPARIDFSSIGYTPEMTNEINDKINSDIAYSEQLLAEYSDTKEYDYNSKLVYAPLFPTQNRTSFYDMFGNCENLEIVPSLDTANGTSFSSMFRNCSVLQSVQLFDTANGTSFSSMFSSCYKLQTIPAFNTSKGRDFNYMFKQCQVLTTIPPLDVSNGKYFGSMFDNCYKLSTVPPLDTANGTSFSYMFSTCYDLRTISSLNLSKGDDFGAMFFQCNDLTDITLVGSVSATIDFSPCSKLSYDSIKSILTACSNTTNTNAKRVSFNRTISDQNQELTNLVTQCTEKGWQIQGLTIQ